MKQSIYLFVVMGLMLSACSKGGGTRESGEYDFTAKEIALMQPKGVTSSGGSTSGTSVPASKDPALTGIKLTHVFALPQLITTKLPKEIVEYNRSPKEVEYSTDKGNSNHILIMYASRPKLTDEMKMRKATIDEIFKFRSNQKAKTGNSGFTKVENVEIGQESLGRKTSRWSYFDHRSTNKTNNFLHTNFMSRTSDKVFLIGLVFMDKPENRKLYAATKAAVMRYTALKAK